MGGAMSFITPIIKAFAANGDLNRALKVSPLAAMASKALSGSAGTVAGLSKLTGAFGSPTPDRALYVAALVAAIDKANAPGMFNLETQINDLWVKLNNLRTSKSALAEIERLLERDASLTQDLQNVLTKLNQASQQVIQQIK